MKNYPKCIDCKKPLNDYNAKRCQSCAQKERLKNPNKFVGDRSLIIKGFNPDFINKKQKKIIEMFGDYWHNLPDWRKRDKRKLRIYKKLGYKVLIIKKKILINKILKFNNRRK
jgi:very-short-patch-repair endonuclease